MLCINYSHSIILFTVYIMYMYDTRVVYVTVHEYIRTVYIIYIYNMCIHIHHTRVSTCTSMHYSRAS